MIRKVSALLLALVLALSLLSGCEASEPTRESYPTQPETQQENREEEPAPVMDHGGHEESEPMEELPVPGEGTLSLEDVPSYRGRPYAAIHGNQPYFREDEITDRSFETYAPLDALGRCGVAFASIGQDLMPTEERGSIGMVKPSGWHTIKYDCVDGKYLYNRCHLIGYQLTAENANTSNLITGTRYLNIEGMLPFENLVADYIQETDNHVMYRVTPVFKEDNLVASGVLMEGYSVEDEGDGICFCVYAYNVQPGVEINYATGESWPNLPPVESDPVKEPERSPAENADYVLNTNSKKFHYPDCSSVGQMAEHNKEYYTDSRDELIERGYSPCGRCHP